MYIYIYVCVYLIYLYIYHIIPYHIISYHIISYPTLPCPTLPYPILSYPILSYPIYLSICLCEGSAQGDEWYHQWWLSIHQPLIHQVINHRDMGQGCWHCQSPTSRNFRGLWEWPSSEPAQRSWRTAIWAGCDGEGREVKPGMNHPQVRLIQSINWLSCWLSCLVFGNVWNDLVSFWLNIWSLRWSGEPNNRASRHPQVELTSGYKPIFGMMFNKDCGSLVTCEWFISIGLPL